MSLFSSKNKKNTFNPKELNRKQLQQQNLIFVVIAIIIIIALIGIVVYFIDFIIEQMNYIFQSTKGTNVNLEGFDLKGFNEIKEKIKISDGDLENLLEELKNTEPTPAYTSQVTATTSALEIDKNATTTPTIVPSLTPTLTPQPATTTPTATSISKPATTTPTATSIPTIEPTSSSTNSL